MKCSLHVNKPRQQKPWCRMLQCSENLTFTFKVTSNSAKHIGRSIENKVQIDCLGVRL